GWAAADHRPKQDRPAGSGATARGRRALLCQSRTARDGDLGGDGKGLDRADERRGRSAGGHRMGARRQLASCRRLVVKVGSGLITTPASGADQGRIDALADEIAAARDGREVVLVASLIDADLLVLLTDVDGLYTGDPRRDPGARKLDTVDAITDEVMRLVWDRADSISVGGMATKLTAGQKAAASGIPMVIASGRQPGALARLLADDPVGTYFAPKAERLTARKRWIAFAVPPQG